MKCLGNSLIEDYVSELEERITKLHTDGKYEYLMNLWSITILVNSYVHLGQHQALVQLWMSVTPKPASAMALNHQWTDHDHKEGEPSIWGLMLSSQKLKQENTDTPELTNIHCTQTVPSIRTANWLQVLSPSSPFLQKWWGIFISKSAVPIF